MKKIYLLLLISGFLNPLIFAQEIISSGANYVETPTGSLSWTIGETVAETYSDGMGFLTQGFHQVNMSPIVCQSLNLPQGWGIISTYIFPTFPSVDHVFQAVVSNLVIVKNGDGNVYWPLFNLNTIGNMEVGKGYKVKMVHGDALSICGTFIVPENTPISLPAKWSLLGYLRQSPASIPSVLSTILPAIIIMKDEYGLPYWPALGINMISNIMPGKGYQLKLSSAQILTYPPNTN